MKISRHARNNMRLYGIPADDLRRVIECADYRGKEEKKQIAIKHFSGKYSEYPIKIVYEETGQGIYIITAYPLKKSLGEKS